MNSLVRVLVRLYPAWWRQRYGNEFEALLDDVTLGPLGFFDVLKGALAMRIKTAGMIPVACALLGALVGGLITLQTPALFASSATIRLNSAEGTGAEPASQRLRAWLDSVPSHTKAATSVTLRRGDSRQTTVMLTYRDTDPAHAQRIARMLTDSIAARTSAGAEILRPPSLPESAIRRDYSTPVATGGGVGLMAGGLVLLFLRSRKRPSSAV